MQRSAAAITTLLVLLALSVVNVTALGINCRGSSLCSGKGNAMVALRDGINRDIDRNRQYSNGKQIACTDNNICAFVQDSSGSVSGDRIATLMPYLVDHRCATCGSVPLDYPNSNDVSQGELTVNYVQNACYRVPGTYICN